jgi:hypothetical protein
MASLIHRPTFFPANTVKPERVYVLGWEMMMAIGRAVVDEGQDEDEDAGGQVAQDLEEEGEGGEED